jgi:hypothetical protein
MKRQGTEPIHFCTKIGIWKEYLKTGKRAGLIAPDFNVCDQSAYKIIQSFYKFREACIFFKKGNRWEASQIDGTPYYIALSEIERKITPDLKHLDSNYYQHIRGII